MILAAAGDTQRHAQFVVSPELLLDPGASQQVPRSGDTSALFSHSVRLSRDHRELRCLVRERLTIRCIQPWSRTEKGVERQKRDRDEWASTGSMPLRSNRCPWTMDGLELDDAYPPAMVVQPNPGAALADTSQRRQHALGSQRDLLVVVGCLCGAVSGDGHCEIQELIRARTTANSGMSTTRKRMNAMSAICHARRLWFAGQRSARSNHRRSGA